MPFLCFVSFQFVKLDLRDKFGVYVGRIGLLRFVWLFFNM